MNLNFAVKEPGNAYISNRLWLPKAGIRTDPVKRALEFVVNGGPTGQVMLRMWDESSSHIICPREFLPHSEYGKFKFPFIDLRPDFQKVEFEEDIQPRDAEQVAAWESLTKHDNGILNLACGKGKTILAVKKVAQRKVPTLVIVPDGGILSQWQEAIERHLRFDGELGLIQGPVFNWAKPITLALVTTLWKRIEDGAIPEEVFRYFGQVIYDEVHQIGAPKFSLTAEQFYGDRIGLTATVQREDGLDPVYRYHIGEPFYSDLTQQLIPEIVFQQTPARIRWEEARPENSSTTNISLLRGIMGRDLVANIFRYWHIKAALDNGRKILVISHSVNQLKLFHALFPGSALIIGATAKEERMQILRDSQLCFAIAKLGSTGVDDDKLDTLFWLTPFRSKIALQQSMGRIQRPRPGKRQPLMVVFEDWMAPPIKTMCNALKGELKRWGFKFSTIKPNNLPQVLPAEVREIYDRVSAELDPDGDEAEGAEDVPE